MRGVVMTAVGCGVAGLGLWGCASGSGGGSGDDAGEVSAVEELAALMEGEFSSAAQAAAQPGDYFEIDVRVGRIDGWTGDGVVYVAMEQAVAGRAPYRQRVYRLDSDGDGGVTSTVLWYPSWVDEADVIGAWRDASVLAGIPVEDLEDRGCVVEIERAADGDWVFEGATRGMGCPSDFGGAVRATSAVRFNASGFEAWDQGWGPTDDQVWGPTEGPYRFRRVR